MRSISVTVLLVSATLSQPGAARAEAPDPRPGQDTAGDVRKVFAAKCAACHGADLAKPKGRFGYVLDLGRVAGNREMVIPSAPDESELWVLVQRNEMPPADSPHGPLTAEEKEKIRLWIASGAPNVGPAPSSGESTSALPQPPTAIEPSVLPLTQRAVRWLGKFHLLLLHFPIALMLAAGVGEFVARRSSREPSPAVLFCLSVAAVAIVPAVAFGWLHAAAGNGVGSPQLLNAHRWLGTVAGVWIIGTALDAWWEARRGVRSWSGRVALIVGIALVAATAHFGGLMAHGSDFFDW